MIELARRWVRFNLRCEVWVCKTTTEKEEARNLKRADEIFRLCKQVTDRFARAGRVRAARSASATICGELLPQHEAREPTHRVMLFGIPMVLGSQEAQLLRKMHFRSYSIDRVVARCQEEIAFNEKLHSFKASVESGPYILGMGSNGIVHVVTTGDRYDQPWGRPVCHSRLAAYGHQQGSKSAVTCPECLSYDLKDYREVVLDPNGTNHDWKMVAEYESVCTKCGIQKYQDSGEWCPNYGPVAIRYEGGTGWENIFDNGDPMDLRCQDDWSRDEKECYAYEYKLLTRRPPESRLIGHQFEVPSL